MRKKLLFFLIFFFLASKTVFASISFSSNSGGLGNIITATATSNEFGINKGNVIFYGTDPWENINPYREENAYIFSWTQNRIVYQVPIRIPYNRADAKYHFKIVNPNSAVIINNASTIYILKQFSQINPQLPSRIVINQDQGLGVCHAVDQALYNRQEISWQYPPAGSVPWNKIQPDNKNENYYDWSILDSMVQKATTSNKKIWIQVGTTEGAVPDWAITKGVTTAGSRCESRLAKQSCILSGKESMGCDASCSLDGKNHAKGTPIPWNSVYQNLLQKLIYKMAERYDGNPAVEAVLTMAGGCYGELTICESKQLSTAPVDEPIVKQWKTFGYTNDRYVEAAKNIIDIYLKETQPDGSHGFLQTPIAEQLGMGLYTDGSLFVSSRIAKYANEKYGFRVWLKQNGLDAFEGTNGDYYWYYRRYVGNTRVGYERGKWDAAYGNCARLDNNYTSALNDTSSFTCASPDDLTLSVNGNCRGFNQFAKFSGTHLNLTNPTFTKDQNDRFTFSGNWTNLGNFPLIGQKRIGIKDYPSSYKLAFYFINSQTGNISGKISIDPAIPTTNWFGYKTQGSANLGPNIFTVSNTIDAKTSIPNGTYTIKLALEDEGRNNLRFKLVDSGGLSENQDKTYNLPGSYIISQSNLSTPTPSIYYSPTPDPLCIDGDKGNLNCDPEGKINELDVNIISNYWTRTGPVSQPITGQRNADLNGDGKVDEKDLTIIYLNWKQ